MNGRVRIIVIALFVLHQSEPPALYIDRVSLVQPTTEVDVFAGHRAKGKGRRSRLGVHSFLTDGTSNRFDFTHEAVFWLSGRVAEQADDGTFEMHRLPIGAVTIARLEGACKKESPSVTRG